MSRLEGAYDQVNERLGDLRVDVREGDAALRAEIREGDAALRAEIREGDAALRAEMTKQFHTLLVLIGGVWATMAGGFIALFLRG